MESVRYWWQQTKLVPEDRARALTSTAESIEQEQLTLYKDFERYASLYKDRLVDSFQPGTWKRKEGYEPTLLSYNVIRSCVNTMQSRITLHEPMSRILTSEGSEKDQDKSRKLERFVDGALKGAKAYKKARRAFRDACLYGIGILKVYPGKGRVKVDYVHPSRLIVDDNAALEREPNTYYQYDYKSREELIALFPDHADEIKQLTGEEVRSEGLHVRDLIKVWEGWHEGPEGVDGRHTMSCEELLLLDEPLRGKAPFVVIRWSEDLLGWHGIGIAEELEGLQQTINELIEKVQDNMDLLSVPYIAKNKNSQILDDHLGTNLRARIIEYVGERPQFEYPPAVNPQVLQWLEQLYQRAFEIVGISQFSASSQKPGSLRSGLALMTYQDVETQRFSTVSHQWSEFFVELGHAIIRAGKQVEGWKVQATSRDFIESITWSEVNMAEDRFVIQVYPQSSLPRQPAGRSQRIVEFTQAQILDPQEARQLLDLPDLDKYNRLANAEIDDLERGFEHMIKHGEYLEPVEFQNLELGLKLAVRYFSRARIESVEDDKIGLLVQWMQEASDLLQPPQPETPAGPPPGPGPGMPPPGGEMAPGQAPPPPAPPVNPLAPVGA